MNGSLFTTMMKINLKSVFSYAIGSALYLLLMIWVYPSFAGSAGLNEMIKSMPVQLTRVLGIEGGFSGLVGFMSSEFYGLIFILILMIYSVVTAVQLAAHLVDRGSMAYLLATPVSRIRIAVTQGAVLLSGLLMISVVATISGLLEAHWMIHSNDFNTARFIEVNLIGFLLYVVVSGYSFVFSCAFNDEKHAQAAAGGLSVLFYVLSMASKMSPKLDWMKFLTPYSLFQPAVISKGTFNVLPAAIELGAAGIVLFILAVAIFRRRDLPL